MDRTIRIEPRDTVYYEQTAALMRLAMVEDLDARYDEVRRQMGMALLGMPLDSLALSQMEVEVENAIDRSIFSAAHVARLRIVRAAVSDVCAIRRAGEDGRQPDTVTENE